MKNDNNLFSIGEIAKAVGLTRRIILNYEAHGLIQPDVKSATSGNRYYTIDTFTQIRTIRVFQELGLSLDEIRAYFFESSDLTPLIHRLESLRDALNLNIEKLRERAEPSASQIKEVQLAAQWIYRRTYQSDSVAERTVLLRNTALEAMRSCGTDISRRMYFIEYAIDNPSEISFCVSVPPNSQGEYVEARTAMRAICIFHHGAYEELPTVRQRLLAYARENGMQPQGTIRHTYLEGPPQHKDKKKFITQVALPII